MHVILMTTQCPLYCMCVVGRNEIMELVRLLPTRWEDHHIVNSFLSTTSQIHCDNNYYIKKGNIHCDYTFKLAAGYWVNSSSCFAIE